MRTDLPTGTVTFLFTDVEGSTRLLHELGAEAYAQALAEHRRVLREAFTRHGGVEVDTQGDAFFIAFPTAQSAVDAAAEAQQALAEGPIRVRMGIHTGTPVLTAEGYVGPDVHRAARIAAAGHGGQVLVSSSTAGLLGATGLRDLGEHRLKDLSAPDRLYQLGESEFPPLRTLYQTNLPIPTTSFVGREREVAEVDELLRRDDIHLVTLTGSGGTGKTRLALAVAAAVAESFPDGVWWVPLTPLRDPALVMPEIARAVGASDGPAEHIGDRKLLLVVDNLEQVIGAAAELAALAQACPRLRLLATSRELLRVGGEEEYAVPPLGDDEAETLFAARSGVTDPAVAELCRRLDNLPLAIELAAARARLLSPAQILDRLETRLDLFRGARDADARQQTLRATIEWSHALLNPDEQRLFARLAVFRGGWTVEAAEFVVDADLDTLASLLDKSLIARTGERMRMLETIRAFAEERLAASGEADAIRQRHLQHHIGLAERWYANRFASESALLAVVDAEADNARAALEWARRARPGQEIQLIGAIAPLWSLNGRTSETLDRLRAALSTLDGDAAIRARAQMHLGELENDVGRLEDALAMWREIEDPEGEAVALEALGWAHDALGDYAAAQARHEESLDVRRRAQSPPLRALSARAGLCHVLVAGGETTAAEAVARELLELARTHNAVLMEQLALHFLADCPLIDGDWDEAETRYRRALAYARAASLIGRATDELLGVAMALAGSGESARAARLAAAAHAKQAEIGKGSDAWWRGMQERLLGGARDSLSDPELERTERSGRDADFEAILDEVLSPETADATA